MKSAVTGVKVFGNTDEFHFKWNSRGLPGKIRIKSCLKSTEIVFNSDRVRKSISFIENSMCIIVSIGLYIGRHCRLAGLCTTEFILSSSGAWKSRIKVSSWLGSGEGPLVGYILLLSCGSLTWLKAQ